MPLKPSDIDPGADPKPERPRLERIGAKLDVMNWVAVALIAGALFVGLFVHH